MATTESILTGIIQVGIVGFIGSAICEYFWNRFGGPPNV